MLDVGIPVRLNTVMTQQGLEHLAKLPDYIHDTFGHIHSNKLQGLMFSYPTEPFERALLPEVLPNPIHLRTVLRETLDRALALELRPHGLDGPCGPALCAFGADHRVASLSPIPGPVDFRMYLDGCNDCAVKVACFGVRPEAYELYGDDCISPIRETPS